MTTRIVVEIPDCLLVEVDRLISEGVFDSRMQAIYRGLAAVTSGGFETDQELAEATRGAIASICEEPWERWW